MNTLKSRHAVVTGGGTGIGAAVVQTFAQRGGRVTLVCPPGGEQAAHEVTDSLAQHSGEVQIQVCDVAAPAAVRRLVEAATSSLGDIEIVVANAGIATAAPTTAGVNATFEKVLATDLYGIHNLFALTVPGMSQRRWGRLIATSSISGHLYGWGDHVAYCAAKAAVGGLIRTYAAEFSPTGVTVNAVAPGVVRSPQSLDEVNSLGERGLDAVRRHIPVGYVADPEDVAGVYAFLASDDAAYMTGQILIVDGGLSVVEPG